MSRTTPQQFTPLVMLVTVALSTGALAQQAQIPESLHGTYSLTFQTDHPQPPLPDGAQAELVLAPGGALCIADYLLTDPQPHPGNASEALWTASDVGVQLALSDITGSLSQIDVLTLEEDFLGQFTGSKTSDSTACGSLDAIPQNIEDIDSVFVMAEQAFPDLFPADTSDASLRVLDGFIYRHYPASGAYIGINENGVHLMGGPFGNQPEQVGSIASTRAQLHAELGLQPPGEDPDIGVVDGEFTLTVSGTASMTVNGQTSSQQLDEFLVVEAIAPPETTDEQALEDELLRQLDESTDDLDPDAISNLSINGLAVSEDRVFFNVTFDADMVVEGNDVFMEFDLDYEYLRN